MLHKTRGIVFKVTDYSESSVVAQIFTEDFGVQSYLINGVKRPKGKIRLSMLQPLHLLDMVVYFKPNAGIQRISELRCEPLLQSIPYDIAKSSIVLFINEILYKCVKHQYEDAKLFEFLHSSIALLDQTAQSISNFHLYFLLQLSRYLGFYPDKSRQGTCSYFDLKNGGYVKTMAENVFVLSEQHTSYFTGLLNSDFGTFHTIKIPGRERRLLLEKLVLYYQIHVEDLGQIKSHLVLEEVLG